MRLPTSYADIPLAAFVVVLLHQATALKESGRCAATARKLHASLADPGMGRSLAQTRFPGKRFGAKRTVALQRSKRRETRFPLLREIVSIGTARMRRGHPKSGSVGRLSLNSVPR
jgi:hypothetical protein